MAEVITWKQSFGSVGTIMGVGVGPDDPFPPLANDVPIPTVPKITVIARIEIKFFI
jgi:hypothetical protein